jgi:hypothetical protein
VNVTTGTLPSATGTARDAPRPSGRGGAGIPFARCVRLETRKIVDTRSGRWLLVAIGVATAAALAVVLGFAHAPGADLRFAALVALTSVVQVLLYPVLGILATTAETSQRTGLVTFVVEPRRLRVAAAKLVAAGFWAIVGLVLAVALAAVAHLVAVLVFDVPADWAPDRSMLAGIVLVQLLAVAQGSPSGCCCRARRRRSPGTSCCLPRGRC